MDVKIENWTRRNLYRDILVSNKINTINKQIALIIGNCNYASIKACIRINQ